FLLTHQGVAFDLAGRLIDGQHRLRAIMKSGTAVMVLVFDGCDPEAFGVIDQGKKRGSGDLFAIKMRLAGLEPKNNIQCASVAAAAVRGLASGSENAQTSSDFAFRHHDVISELLTQFALGNTRLYTGMIPIGAFLNAILFFG